ncbi:MAG: hypothetical protein KJ977_05325 [Candidatus Omnitrophica bacterium]|nr:hypothetical protein [Candidatus Omnitrophota bacterium]
MTCSKCGRAIDPRREKYEVCVACGARMCAVCAAKTCRCGGVRFVFGELKAQLHFLLQHAAENTSRDLTTKEGRSDFHLDVMEVLDSAIAKEFRP